MMAVADLAGHVVLECPTPRQRAMQQHVVLTRAQLAANVIRHVIPDILIPQVVPRASTGKGLAARGSSVMRHLAYDEK